MISCLRGAGVEVVERHASVWERRRHKWSLGLGAALAAGGGRGAARPGRPARALRRDDRRLSRATSTCPPHGGSRAAGRSSSTRSSRSPTRSSSDRGRFAPRLAGRAAAPPRRPARAPARRPRRRGHRRRTRASSRELGELPRERVEVCFVGAEERLFRPGWQPPESFHVLFVGKLIPLHGLETILEAARLAPELAFRIVGSGQLDALLARPARRTSSGSTWVEYERAAGARSSAPAARSGSSGRRRRRRA